jgi:hypothetical protein
MTRNVRPNSGCVGSCTVTLPGAGFVRLTSGDISVCLRWKALTGGVLYRMQYDCDAERLPLTESVRHIDEARARLVVFVIYG